MRLMQLTSTEAILHKNRGWGREGVGCKLVMNQLIMQQPGSVCTQRSAACRWCCTPNSPQGLLRGATVHFASHFAIPRRASYRYNFLLQASPIAYTSVIQFHDSPLEKNNQETDLVSESKDMPCCYSAVTSSSISVTVPLQAHQSGHSSCPSSPPARSMDTSSLDSASTSMPLALSSHPLIPAAKARRKESASGSSSGWSNDTVPAVICFIWGAQGRWGGSESTELRVAAAESVLDYTWVGILG